MKLALVILTVLVGLHAAVATVEVISPVIERSTVPGVPDRVRYVRHIQYEPTGSLGSFPGHGTERLKRQTEGLTKAPMEAGGAAVKSVMEAGKPALASAMGTAMPAASPVVKAGGPASGKAMDAVKPAASTAMTAAGPALGKTMEAGKPAASPVMTAAMPAVSPAMGGAMPAVYPLMGETMPAVSPAMGLVVPTVVGTLMSAASGHRRRRSQMPQLPTNVIHALPSARVPVFEGRTRRSSPMVGRMRRSQA